MKIGIVATHGVLPHPRYGFQDDVATALCGALNAHEKKKDAWTASVVFEPVDPKAPDVVAAQKPTIVRVHKTNDPADQPQNDFFDVHEAYWSPIDKGKTNAASVGSWLVRTIFLPFNNVARYEEQPIKAAWDIGFILSAIGLAVAFFLIALIFAAWAVGVTAGELNCAAGATDINCAEIHKLVLVPHFPFVQADYGKAIQILFDPKQLTKQFGPLAIAALVVGAFGAFLIAQAVRAGFSIVGNFAKLIADPIQLVSRVIWTAAVAAIGIAGVVYCGHARVEYGIELGDPAVGLVIALLAFQAGRSIVATFVTQFFGDVQIYTTRDENESFFAMREAILDIVTRTIVDVVRVPPGGVEYDRVYVFAHSLGTTISLDALLRLSNLHKEGGITEAEWTRIRAFVTFGTSLEKTKYFTDAWSPTLSQQYQEWRNDLYGTLFTPDPKSLEGPKERATGIYWLNCWYFSDFVSDQICSYRSVLLPGDPPSMANALRKQFAAAAQQMGTTRAGKLVAQNRGRFGSFNPLALHVVTHGDYLTDPWFWNRAPAEQDTVGVLDIVLSGLTTTPHPHPLLMNARTDLVAHAWKRDERRYEEKPRGRGFQFWTRDVLK